MRFERPTFCLRVRGPYGIGLILNESKPQDGRDPLMACQVTFGFSLALQVLALLWFAVLSRRNFRRGLPGYSTHRRAHGTDVQIGRI